MLFTSRPIYVRSLVAIVSDTMTFSLHVIIASIYVESRSNLRNKGAMPLRINAWFDTEQSTTKLKHV